MTTPFDIGAGLPDNEVERLLALYRYNVLDTPAEEVFDCLTRLAAAITNAPLAQLNLVDRDRQWAKSIFGDGWAETPRSLSFCAYTILQDDVLNVPDTRLDSRFQNHPAVTEENSTVRFYAGAPLRTSHGHNLGALCIVDGKPRAALDPEQQMRLRDLAKVAVALIENRLETARRTEAERRKDEFIATVTHELRTPLTSLHGALKLVASGVGGQLPAPAERLMGIAASNAQRMTLIIDDVLDLERGEAGCLPIHPIPIDLRASVTEAVLALEPYADDYNVRFEISQSGEIPLLPADPNRLQQVLANLLSNAIKFSPSGGIVTIHLDHHDSGIRISVTDTGPGIPIDFQPHIFQKFAQANVANDRQKGSGLGLGIARVIVEAHGGQIGFDTAASQGTTFWFTLPLQRSADGEQSTE